MRCPRLTRSDDVALSIERRCKFEVEVGPQSYATFRNHVQLHLLTNGTTALRLLCELKFFYAFSLSCCFDKAELQISMPSRNRVSAEELRLTVDTRWKLHHPVS